MHGRIVVFGPGNLEVASWPLESSERPDLSIVDALARLHLAARRLGCSIRVSDPCPELRELLDLVGLRNDLQVRGEAEGGEQLGVEEVVVPDDPVA